MANLNVQAMALPLTRKTRHGDVLKRPARIQAEIAAALQLSPNEILARATAGAKAKLGAASMEQRRSEEHMSEESMSEEHRSEEHRSEGPVSKEHMSEECMVHLIRHDLRARSGNAGRLAERLVPILLERSEGSLRGSIRGFPSSAAAEIREEILGRLAVSLAGPGDEADFLEVRFALALKRLRIDVCRRERRRLQGLVALEEVSAVGVPEEDSAALDHTPPAPPDQEDRLLIRQALSTLTPEERNIVVLHKLAGVPLASNKRTAKPGPAKSGTPKPGPRKKARNGPTRWPPADEASLEEWDPESLAGATLVGLLGRSERTLRNRLRSAEAKLAAYHQAQPQEDRR